MDSKDHIQAWLEHELGDWSENTQAILIEAIRKKGLVLSQDLLNSMQHEVQMGTSDQVQRIRFAFEDYGRMREMKNLFSTQMPPLAAMEGFVQKIGVDKFRYVPGYKNKAKVPSESVAIKRIAWGIAKGRLNSWQHKPKKWFAKNFYGQINNLILRLLDGYQQDTLGNIKDSFR